MRGGWNNTFTRRRLSRLGGSSLGGALTGHQDPFHKVFAAPGAYNVTGTDPALKHAWITPASAGSYAMTGTDATLTYVSNSVGGGALTSGETDALGIDFTYHTDRTKQMSVKDTGTPANAGDFDPYSKLTYTSPSLKLCRQSDGTWKYGNHNLFTRSSEFDNAVWTKARCTVTANATTGPDGTSTADKLVEDATAGNNHLIFRNDYGSTVSGFPVQYSVYAKADTRSWIRMETDAGASIFFNVGAGAGAVGWRWVRNVRVGGRHGRVACRGVSMT